MENQRITTLAQFYALMSNTRKTRKNIVYQYLETSEVESNNIDFLLKAYRQLGNEQYRKAALRGMQFVVTSQLGPPQAGWAQQYDMELKPGKARNYEPAAVAPSTTVANIRNLMRFYKITGDRRYLGGVPGALSWLENSKLPPGHSDQGHTHAQFVEVGTNRPLYAHREGTSIDDGRYWVDYEPRNFPGHYGMQTQIDVKSLRNEYERVFALTPEQATAEYRAELEAKPAPPKVAADKVRMLIDTMDKRGAWVEEFTVVDYEDWKYRPRRQVRGYCTSTYTGNMKVFLQYLTSPEEAKK